jgi:mycothiol system anti-sigma-R factor
MAKGHDHHDGDVDCSDAVHTMYHFLDGEIDDERRQHIQRHLEECLPCFEAFDFEAELRQLIAHKCREQAPDHLRARIADSLRLESGIGHRPGPDPLGPRGIPNL